MTYLHCVCVFDAVRMDTNMEAFVSGSLWQIVGMLVCAGRCLADLYSSVLGRERACL